MSVVVVMDYKICGLIVLHLLLSAGCSLAAFMTREETRYIALALTPYDSQTPWIEQERFLGVFQTMLATFQMG